MRVRVAAAGWRAGRGSCFDIIAPSLASSAIPGYRSAHPPLGAHMPAVGHRRPFLLNLTGADLVIAATEIRMGGESPLDSATLGLTARSGS